jgi:hypothetical protein
MKFRTAIIVCMMACLQASSAQNRGRSGAEQTHFSAEDATVKRPIVLPDDALRVIEEDPLVAEMRKKQVPPTTQIPKGWLTASEVRLAGPGENDIVVVAEGLLMGANVTTFWVLRPSSRGYELLLAAPAHDLFIRNTRSKGYKDIELFSATAANVSTVALGFDGKRYEVRAK